MILNRRCAFTGSANLTDKSADNLELCFRLEGPPVAKILNLIAVWTGRACLWDGQ